jgi:hypothetical protein
MVQMEEATSDRMAAWEKAYLAPSGELCYNAMPCLLPKLALELLGHNAKRFLLSFTCS